VNIVFIGYRCSGKTIVGREIAQRLNRLFVDVDDLLESEAGRFIEDLVKEQGWDCFRELEKKVIAGISGRDGLVIATGGGAVTNEENVRLLREKGFIIWLKAGPEILKQRMGRDQSEGKKRPSLTGQDPVAEIKMMLNQRAPLYEQASDLVVDTGRWSISETVEKIMTMIPPG